MPSPIERYGLRPTIVYDSFWSFAANRQAIYWSKLERANRSPVDDGILQRHRFTNAYRALDRVSQYLIAQVQRGPNASPDLPDQAFRTLLFKIFNKIETWEALEEELGPIRLTSFDYAKAGALLEARRTSGQPIYSAAYIMPSPNFGNARKHENHMALLKSAFSGTQDEALLCCERLEDAFNLLSKLSGIGPFLAFQFAVDLGYLDQLAFDEAEFVVAGPGARDGIAKSFENWREFSLEETIMAVRAVQDEEFECRGIEFRGLANRSLQPVDCQNLFCEISKYARVAHPQIVGANGRSRIKQRYIASETPLPYPVFPAHWHVPLDGAPK